MKKINRFLILVLCAALMTAGYGTAAEEAGKRVFRPGTSSFAFEIPETVAEGEVTEEAAAFGMVAYLYDLDAGLFMEIYQYDKENNPADIEAFVEQEATKYGGEDVVKLGDTNKILSGWFYVRGTPDNPEEVNFCLILDDIFASVKA